MFRVKSLLLCRCIVFRIVEVFLLMSNNYFSTIPPIFAHAFDHLTYADAIKPHDFLVKEMKNIVASSLRFTQLKVKSITINDPSPDHYSSNELLLLRCPLLYFFGKCLFEFHGINGVIYFSFMRDRNLSRSSIHKINKKLNTNYSIDDRRFFMDNLDVFRLKMMSIEIELDGETIESRRY